MRNPTLRFTLFFIVLVSSGLAVERVWHPSLSPAVTRAYASAAAGAIALATPGQAVSRSGAVISSAGRPIIEVTRECDGMTSVILLAAAVLALPSTVALKALGLALGFLLTVVCNFARITALFYVFNFFPNQAETMHVFLGPLAIMLPSLAFFLYWSRPRAASLILAKAG